MVEEKPTPEPSSSLCSSTRRSRANVRTIRSRLDGSVVGSRERELSIIEITESAEASGNRVNDNGGRAARNRGTSRKLSSKLPPN